MSSVGSAGYVSSADFHRRIDSARLLRTRSALHARCGSTRYIRADPLLDHVTRHPLSPTGLNPAGG